MGQINLSILGQISSLFTWNSGASNAIQIIDNFLYLVTLDFVLLKKFCALSFYAQHHSSDWRLPFPKLYFQKYNNYNQNNCEAKSKEFKQWQQYYECFDKSLT